MAVHFPALERPRHAAALCLTLGATVTCGAGLRGPHVRRAEVLREIVDADHFGGELARARRAPRPPRQ